MKELTNKLLLIKDEIETTEKESSVLEGKVLSLTERLKTDFGCDSVEDATIRIAELEKELIAKQKECEDIIKELRENYRWKI